MMTRFVCSLALLALIACGNTPPVTPDAGVDSGQVTDSGSADSGASDAGVDGGFEDAGVDAGP